jgi:hypothetical protein
LAYRIEDTMQATITEKLLRSVLANGQRKTIRDQVVIGLEARPRERWIAFNIVRRLPGARQPVRIAVGRYPEMGLAQLRDRGRRLLRDIGDGVDPRRRKAEQLEQEAAADERRFGAMKEMLERPPAAGNITAEELNDIVNLAGTVFSPLPCKGMISPVETGKINWHMLEKGKSWLNKKAALEDAIAFLDEKLNGGEKRVSLRTMRRTFDELKLFSQLSIKHRSKSRR